MPIHFAFPEGLHIEHGLSAEQIARFSELFDPPDLATMDDELVNGEIDLPPDAIQPLSHFTAPRVDYSLHRLRHYTGTDASEFQNFILLTNYQFYVDGFRQVAERLVADPTSQYTDFAEPASSDHGPQMPAYHLKRDDLNGITLINIGVGPSNAKTMTDHVAVLRPSAWIMLGHCAGLRRTQRLGDYVLAHAYVRDDHVLDADLPLWVPIPALAEVQTSLEQAVAEVTGLDALQRKQVMRTGTVASIDNRNWELRDQAEPVRRFFAVARHRPRHGMRDGRCQRIPIPRTVRDTVDRVRSTAPWRTQAARYGLGLLPQPGRPPPRGRHAGDRHHARTPIRAPSLAKTQKLQRGSVPVARTAAGLAIPSFAPTGLASSVCNASIRPAPNIGSGPRGPRSTADFTSRSFTFSELRSGSRSNIRAITPLTCAAAKDVPDLTS